MRFSNLYDKKYLIKCLAWFGVVFGLMKATGGVGFAIVIPMVLFCALTHKTEGLLFWLLVAICALIVNPHLVSKGGGFPLMQRGLMVFLGSIMSINVMSYPMHNVLRPFAGMLIFIFIMGFSSAQGWNPTISCLKLLLFSLIYFAYVGVSNQVGINPRVSSQKIRSVMLSVAILFVLGSVVLVPFPGLSQMKASDFEFGIVDLSNFKSLFMGMTNHSQCLAPVVSILAIILLGDLFFSIKKADPLYILLLACCPYLIYITSSRTGMGAFVLGLLFVLWVFMSAHGVGSRWKSRVIGFAMTALILFVCVLAFNPFVQDKAVKFLLKTGSDDTSPVTMEAVASSRIWLVESELHNFKKSPLLGNGFQVSEEMKHRRGNSLSILSAPIEKGVWVAAVLEEGGVIGFAIFVVFLLACIVKSIQRRAYIGASCLFVFTVSNLGEFTFFSMSYAGGFAWAMVFVGLALDIRKMKDENLAIQKEMMHREMEMKMVLSR